MLFQKNANKILILLFILALFLIPGVFIGVDYTIFLHKEWFNAINPAGNRYFFENDNACNSLNCVLPAFFYDFGNNEEIRNGFERKLLFISFGNLNLLLQLLRILLLAIIVYAVVWYYYCKKIKLELYLFWPIGIVCAVSLLIFPHQLKYSNLYVLPAGSYLIMYFIKTYGFIKQISIVRIVSMYFISILLFLQAIMGRDFIGAFCVNILDYTHFLGISNFIVCISMIYFKPNFILQHNLQKSF